MSNFKLFETAQFLKNLEEEFGEQQGRIKRKLRSYVYPQLKQQPYFGKNIKKLRNYKPETWRYIVGNYRFFYEIAEHRKIIFMISADNRADAY